MDALDSDINCCCNRAGLLAECPVLISSWARAVQYAKLLHSSSYCDL